MSTNDELRDLISTCFSVLKDEFEQKFVSEGTSMEVLNNQNQAVEEYLTKNLWTKIIRSSNIMPLSTAHGKL